MTRHLLPFVVPAVLVVALVLSPRPARGCAVAPSKDGDITINSESALIVYDSTTKTEHFIRTANFQTTSAEFGFLVPTPTKPELAEASADVFLELTDVTKRRIEVRTRMKPLGFGCGMLPMAAADKAVAGATPDTARGGVRVVEQKRVGDFDAAVLQASDPKLLRDWLTANGYDARPTLEEWFEAYTANDWFLTAFKIAADSPAAGGQPLALTSAAVRISFPTDRPFYPYREPAEMQAASGERSLRLFVLSGAKVSGTIGNGEGAKAWPARTEWANSLPAERAGAVVSRGKLPELLAGREWHLTEFFDPSSPRPGTDELYFQDAADQTPVERPPQLIWEEYDPWPWVFGGVGIAMLAMFGVVVWRLIRGGRA